MAARHNPIPVTTNKARDEDSVVSTQKNFKRTRSYVLREMLEEVRRVKKESIAATEEIEGTKVKTEPVVEEEEEIPVVRMNAKGKQQNPTFATGHVSRAYHASVYRASFQPCRSRRDQHNKGLGKQKGKAVADPMSGVVGSMRREEKGEACISGTAGIGERRPRDKKDKKSTNPSRKSAPKSPGMKEQSWTRVVDNPVKLRNNVLHIPRAVIRACISGNIPRITLVDRDNNVPYYCEMTKREKTVDRYIFGGWSDFCKDRNLQKGDTLRFCIRHPPVVEISVAVQRGKA